MPYVSCSTNKQASGCAQYLCLDGVEGGEGLVGKQRLERRVPQRVQRQRLQRIKLEHPIRNMQ